MNAFAFYLMLLQNLEKYAVGACYDLDAYKVPFIITQCSCVMRKHLFRPISAPTGRKAVPKSERKTLFVYDRSFI